MSVYLPKINCSIAPSSPKVFSPRYKKEEILSAEAAVKAIKAHLVEVRLQKFLILLQDPKQEQSALLKAFYAIDQEEIPCKIGDFLALSVWIAEGRPLGDPCFGQHAIEADARILLRIRNEMGKNIIEQLIAYFTEKTEREQQIKELLEYSALLKDSKAQEYALLQAFRKLPEVLRLKLIDRVERSLSATPGLQIGLSEIELNPRILQEHIERLVTSLKQISLSEASEVLRSTAMLSHPVASTHSKDLMVRIPSSEAMQPRSVILVGAESTHLLKQGGLAEAIFGMAEGLAALSPQNRVRVILPLYDLFPKEIHSKLKAKEEYVFVDSTKKAHRVFKLKMGEIRFYFIEDTSDHFKIGFDVKGKAQSIYGPDDKTVKERFAYFSHCAAEVVFGLCNKKAAKKKPIDAIHLHDWHSAGVALLLSQRYPEAWKKGIIPPLVFTFHNNNGGAQGIYGRETIPTLQQLGISRELNMLTEALRIADHVTTVSPTFAQEAQTEALGAGIASHMQLAALHGKLTGILNGGNPNVWNPETDAQLQQWKDPITNKPIDLRYGPGDDILSKKKVIREQLQKWVALHASKLHIDFSKPILLYVGRYDSYQKGLSMLPAAFKAAIKRGAQCICMGSQEDDKATQILDKLHKETSDKLGNSLGVWIIRDTKGPDGRFIYQQGTASGAPGIGSLVRAAADFVIVPSEFEPCGLVQFEAWLFGTLAICTKTGGLADSVQTKGNHFNGFLIERTTPFQSAAQEGQVATTVEKAFAFWESLDPGEKTTVLRRVIKQARQTNWLQAARQYLYVYAAAKRNLANREFLYLNAGLTAK